jgi:hypothetical protein
MYILMSTIWKSTFWRSANRQSTFWRSTFFVLQAPSFSPPDLLHPSQILDLSRSRFLTKQNCPKSKRPRPEQPGVRMIKYFSFNPRKAEKQKESDSRHSGVKFNPHKSVFWNICIILKKWLWNFEKNMSFVFFSFVVYYLYFCSKSTLLQCQTKINIKKWIRQFLTMFGKILAIKQ